MNRQGALKITSDYQDAIIRLFTGESGRTDAALFILLIGIVAIISATRIYGGLSPIWAPWDVIIALNGGWRIASGQIPHVDYYNPVGVLSYLPTAIAMRVGHPVSSSLVYGNVVFGIILSLWARFIAKDRLPSLFTFLFSLFIFILAISTRPLGFQYFQTSYAMLYNRYGYALYSMLLLLLFIARRPPSRTVTNFDALSGGLILALLLYCKITYFLVGLVTIPIFIVIHRPAWKWVALFCAGFIGAVLVMFFPFRVNPVDYFKDVAIAGEVQAASGRLAIFTGNLRQNLPLLGLTLFLLVFASIVTYVPLRSRDKLWDLLKLWLIVSLIIVSGLLLTSSNTSEWRDLPVYGVAGLVILDYLSIKPTRQSSAWRMGTILVTLSTVFVVGAVFFGYILLKDIASLAHSATWNRTMLPLMPVEQRFQSNTLYDFVIPGNSDYRTAYWRANDVPARINEGLDLLRRHIDADSRVFCLCYSDPFSFGLGLPPAAGTPLFWDEAFNADSFRGQKTIFDDVNIVMVPIFEESDGGCCQETVSLMEKTYGQYLAESFTETDRSEHWALLTRR